MKSLLVCDAKTYNWKSFSIGLPDSCLLRVQFANFMTRMIATGDWTAFDLVKYLTSVRSFLTVPEIGHLSETPAFPKEGVGKEQLAAGTSAKVQPYRARDLYEPIDIFRDLDLPIVDWGKNQWRPKLDEGKFLW